MNVRNAQWRYGMKAVACGLLLVALSIGCSAPTNQQGTAVIASFTATPANLLTGETSVIEILVTDDQGNPRSGVVVTLVADPPTRGTLAEQTLTTGPDGTAATVFTAATSGSVTLEASTEKSTSQYVTLTVEEEASTVDGSIEVTVNPSIVTADQQSQSAVSCRVLDGDGNPVPDGTEIRLVAGEKFADVNKNGVFNLGVDEVTEDLDQDGIWDAYGTIDETITTVDGTAVGYFTSGAIEGTIYIKATAFLPGGVLQRDVQLMLSATVAYLELWVEPRNLRADNLSQATVNCRLLDGSGDPVADGTEIRLTAGDEFADGNGDGIYTCCMDTLFTDNNENEIWDPIGTIDTLVTTLGGEATATYTAGGYASTVFVKATASFAGAFVQKDYRVFLVPDSGYVAVDVSPTRLPADGMSQAMVTIHAYDADNNPMPDGTIATIVAGERFMDENLDGYFGCCNDTLMTDVDNDGQWDAIGSMVGEVTLNGGTATANYTAGTVADSVFIKATITGREIVLQGERGIQLTALDTVSSINLTPEFPRTQVRGTGGIEWTRVTATAYDAFGNRVAPGFPIDFTITAGPGGGENINGDPEGPVTVYTDQNGEAVATFNSGILAGTARIRATAGGVVSAATQVIMTSGPPAYISVGAADCNVPSWEIVNYTNEIVAVVNDQWGNEVADSTAVHFWTEQGTIEGFDETNISFTERGTANSYWHSSKPKNDGIVWYWAATAGGEVADTSTFFESGLPGTTTIILYPSELLADGKDKGDVVVEVFDQNGVFMDTDYPIDLETTFGTIASGGLGDGCHSSYYETELFSQTFEKDYSYSIPDDGIAGISLLQAIAGGYYGASDSKQVTFLSASAYVKNSDIDVETTIPHGYTVPVSVVIKDRYNNPLGGHEISLTSQTGAITGSPQYTDQWGVASGFSYTTSSDFGVALDFLVAEDLDPNYGGISITQKVTVKEDEQ